MQLRKLGKECHLVSDFFVSDKFRAIKKEVHLQDIFSAHTGALSGGSNCGFKEVPTFDIYWLPSADSNHGHGG